MERNGRYQMQVGRERGEGSKGDRWVGVKDKRRLLKSNIFSILNDVTPYNVYRHALLTTTGIYPITRSKVMRDSFKRKSIAFPQLSCCLPADLPLWSSTKLV